MQNAQDRRVTVQSSDKIGPLEKAMATTAIHCAQEPMNSMQTDCASAWHQMMPFATIDGSRDCHTV